MHIIATDIQNFLIGQTIKASDKQNSEKTAKINGTISFKRGHLLAEIDLSRIKVLFILQMYTELNGKTGN